MQETMAMLLSQSKPNQNDNAKSKGKVDANKLIPNQASYNFHADIFDKASHHQSEVKQHNQLQPSSTTEYIEKTAFLKMPLVAQIE
jgi:hypothetical protein